MKRLVYLTVVIGFFLLSPSFVDSQVRDFSGGVLQQAPLTGLYLVPGRVEVLDSFEGVVNIHDYGEARLVAFSRVDLESTTTDVRLIPVSGVETIQYRSWEGTYQSISGMAMDGTAEVGLLALVGPVDSVWIGEIKRAGIEILDQAPPYGLVVHASPSELAACSAIRTSTGYQVVRGWTPIPVEARISSDIMSIARGEESPGEIPGLMRGTAGSAFVRVFPYSNSDRDGMLQRVSRFAPRVTKPAPYGHDDVFEVNGQEILDIVESLSDVSFIEGVYERKLHNNLAVQDHIMNVEPVWNDLGWDGSGVIVDHNDSGVDLNHPDLSGVILATNGAMSNTDNGHGTHTAGSVAGRGIASEYQTNGSGCGDQHLANNWIFGSAPGAHLVVNNIFDGGSSSEDAMMRWGYQNGAHLSTNSWGYGSLSTYSSYAVTVDSRIRDADTTAGGNQDFPIIFSAGNEGPGSSTIGTPGNGKNTLTVGASQNDRCGSYIPGYCSGPSIDLMACFSSRGPAQGRILPDVVGVGADVISVESADPRATNPWDESWTGPDYALSPGTSMSCPLVAGAAAVFYEFYLTTFSAHPSPALVKAAMINGAVDMGYGYPSFDQGWGRVDLRRSIEGPPGGEIRFVDQSAITPLSTGQSWPLPFTVGSSTIPLKITMDWTDPPGAANCSSCLINDLDLVVTSPSGTVYKGNQFTSNWATENPAGKDAVNNVENVFISAPETGNWTIQVISANTSQNPPNLSGQDFALALSGSFCAAQPPTGLSAVGNGDNQIDLTWNAASGATEYRVYRSQASGGPYSQIGTSGTTSYSDTTVSGFVTYYYVVRTFTDCEGGGSSEASASTTGTCTLPPAFSGITSASNGSVDNPCTINLEWNPATAQCAGPVTYRVYRDTTSGFTPAAGNQIAGGVTCSGSPCTYSDVDALVSGTPYFYVVHAVDTSNGAEDDNVTEEFAIPAGLGGGVTNYASTDTPIAIPDNNAGGITSTLNIPATGVISDIMLNVDITHTYKGDLIVRLTSPAGTPVTVHNRSGSSANDIITTYDVPTAPDGPGSMSDFDTESITGDWTLFVSDNANIDTGDLNSWSLDITVDNPCTTGGGCTDPGAVSIDSITDNDPCAQDGVTITFSGGSGATSFDLFVDGGLAESGITSPHAYNPGDSGSHSYVVQAIDGTCTTDSDPELFTDGDSTPDAPTAPSVNDDDICVQDGVTITWGAVAGATAYEVRVDGTTTIYSGSATSFGYSPGDSNSHTYDVRATNPTCGAGSFSNGTAAIDAEGSPGTPAAPTVSDISSCTLSGLQIDWGAVSGATSYDVQLDGTTTIYSGAATTTSHSPGDSNSHTYRVRAVNVCGPGMWSGSSSGTDSDHSFTWAGIGTAADRDACDDTGVAVRWSIPSAWNDVGGPGSRSFTVYREPAVVASGLAETTIGIDDIGGVNGTTYNYSVEAFNRYGCSAGRATTRPASDEVGSEPTFGGLQAVAPIPGEFCGLRLDWNAATSNCASGPTIVYNVYRSTTSGFTPDGTTLEASCVADLYYEDHSVLPATNYYYVVRAEDSSLGHGGPCGNGFEDSNSAEISSILTDLNETANQATDPLQVTGGFATAGFSPAFTIPAATNASVSYTLSHGNGTGGTLSYDYGSGTIIKGATTVFSQTVTETETITSVDLDITLTSPNPASSNLLVELVHVDSSTSVTVYDGPGNGFIDGPFGPYADFNGLNSASEWQLVVTAAGNSRDGILTAWNLSIDYGGSGDSTNCTQVELIDPSATSTVLKAFEVEDANPYDVTDLYTGAGTYQIRLRENCGSQAQVTGGAMSVDAPACVAPSASPLLYFTARSTGNNVKLEWQNSTVGYASTRICWDTAAFPVNPSTCTVLVDRDDGAGNYGTTTHLSLTNGQDYYYSAFVGNGFGEYSTARTVTARPFDTSGNTRWSYHTAATALAPPGLYPGAAGTGASYGVSNDRVLHGMNSTMGGGDWPRTPPFDWIPMGMNGPAQSRPPIVPTTVGAADLVAFLGSQDGHVYAVDAKTGQTLWQSELNYGLIQGAPAGMFTDFGGFYSLLFAGSRVAGSGNTMNGINPLDGSHLWSFGGTIGIISSGATVDYATNRLYFASRENPSGSNHTLWCLSFTDAGASPVWSRPYGDIDSAPVLFDGVLYVGTNAGVVMAVDPDTGDEIWSYATHDGPVKGYVDFDFVPVPRMVFFATTGSVWGLMDNGLSATFTWQESGITGPSIPLTLADEGALYVGSTDGWLYQLDSSTGGVVDSLQMGAGNAAVGSPGYDWVNSLAYVGAEDGSVYAVTLPLQ